jgi:hypothetical protein
VDVAYHSRQMAFRRNQISEWLLHEHNQLQEEIEYRKGQGEATDEDYLSSRIADIESEASVKKNMLSQCQCMGCCKIQILASLPFDRLLLSGVLQLMTLVSFPYMVQALEQMYVKLVFILLCC